MATTRTAKPEMPPPPNRIRGKSTPGKAMFAFNTCVVAFSVTSFLVAFICVSIADGRLFQHKIVLYGYPYVHLFFSLWGTALQSIYFYIRLTNDILEIYSRSSPRLYKTLNNLRIFASYLFFTAVFPMSVAIAAVFWGFYLIDRELIYPTILDEGFPYWINHAMHSVPAVLVLIYAMIETEPPMKRTLPGMFAILAIYASCISYVKSRDNKWIYYGLHHFDDYKAYQLCGVGATTSIFGSILGHSISRYAQSISYVKSRDNKWIYYGLHHFDDYKAYQLWGVGATTTIFGSILGHSISRYAQSFRTTIMAINK